MTQDSSFRTYDLHLYSISSAWNPAKTRRNAFPRPTHWVFRGGKATWHQTATRQSRRASDLLGSPPTMILHCMDPLVSRIVVEFKYSTWNHLIRKMFFQGWSIAPSWVSTWIRDKHQVNDSYKYICVYIFGMVVLFGLHLLIRKLSLQPPWFFSVSAATVDRINPAPPGKYSMYWLYKLYSKYQQISPIPNWLAWLKAVGRRSSRTCGGFHWQRMVFEGWLISLEY